MPKALLLVAITQSRFRSFNPSHCLMCFQSSESTDLRDHHGQSIKSWTARNPSKMTPRMMELELNTPYHYPHRTGPPLGLLGKKATPQLVLANRQNGAVPAHLSKLKLSWILLWQRTHVDIYLWSCKAEVFIVVFYLPFYIFDWWWGRIGCHS